MQKTVPSTLSDSLGLLTSEGVLRLSCPRSWKEMSQEQLRYALHVIGCGMYSSVEGRTLMLLRFTGIEVLGKTPGGWSCAIRVEVEGKKSTKRHLFILQAWQVQYMHRVMFGDYLNMEKHYQGYLATKEHKYALGLARLLYPGGVTDIGDAEQTGCIMWFSYVKKQFSQLFRHFFKPAPEGGKAVNWLEQMNAQIRALTDGDITKERTVLDADCWRALTELDAKAREAEEFRRKYPKS